MARWSVVALQGVIVVALCGSLVVQVAVVWSAIADESPTGIGLSLAVIAVLGVGCLQTIAVCVWRLLTMVGRGTVFSDASFRYVDTVIGAIASGSVLLLAVAVVARAANRSTPGDEVAPGLVGLVCGFALVVAGVALVVYVLRVLLAQAVERDVEARHLQSELDEVI